MRVEGHQDDVNAVAYADTTSRVIFSGSDDCLIKVQVLGAGWDGVEVSSSTLPRMPCKTGLAEKEEKIVGRQGSGSAQAAGSGMHHRLVA